MKIMKTFVISSILLLVIVSCKVNLEPINSNESIVGLGWSNNSVNTVIFRQNAITTHKNIQFTAYYDGESNLILAKRNLPDGKWETHKTQYSGNTSDAHNAISIAIDGSGFLHVSWDHHDNVLRYAVSKIPLGLVLGEKQMMTGIEEGKVSYPQFYNLDNGDLLFLYRSGQSGRGILVVNRYNSKTQKWEQLYQNLLDGEGQRNAYWQAYVDKSGTIHLSWVWRETWDVSTNHDIGYARSKDGGVTWEKSSGEKYQLPINSENTEYAYKVPQNSSLINQTAMTTDNKGKPYIANYWNEGTTTQYQIVYLKDGVWKKENTAFRKTGFNLGGGGTKEIPISRPEILVSNQKSSSSTIYLLFRDNDRGNKISLAYKNISEDKPWIILDLTSKSVGSWEPNFDKELFKKEGKLHIFEQEVIQIDGEGLGVQPPTPVKILEINELPKIK
tara:strand:- start:1756 stop:3087 length:1332 start_codon:yes stop_codon:yes gene_type:complete